MIISNKILIIMYPLIALKPDKLEQQNNLIPYRPYTTTHMMQNHDIKVYEQFWNKIIIEDCDSNSMVE